MAPMACVGDPVRVTASGGRCTAIALGLVAAWGPAAIAWAAEGPVLEVRWDAPAECPADAFTTSLDRLLAGSALVVPIRVEATVARTDDGWSIVRRVLDRAAVLTAFEQLGGAERALEMARAAPSAPPSRRARREAFRVDERVMWPGQTSSFLLFPSRFPPRGDGTAI